MKISTVLFLVLLLLASCQGVQRVQLCSENGCKWVDVLKIEKIEGTSYACVLRQSDIHPDEQIVECGELKE